jgi:hypothetical protein
MHDMALEVVFTQIRHFLHLNSSRSKKVYTLFSERERFLKLTMTKDHNFETNLSHYLELEFLTPTVCTDKSLIWLYVNTCG